MQPREYQQAAVDAVLTYYTNGNKGNVLVAAPTGTGKALMIALLVGTILWQWPGQRIMVCAHSAELLKQNSATLDKLWPGAPFGIYSAELNRRDFLEPVIFGGIGSVVRPAQAFGHRDILIVDEAHLISDSASTMYQRFIASLKETNPNLIVVGLTATPYRMKIGLITDGELFDDIVFDLTSFDNFNRLVSLGYLAPLISRKTRTEYDISGVGTIAGEYNQRELAKAVSKSDITRSACLELISASEDRHCGIIFGDSIEHGEEIAGILNTEGEAAGCVHSKQSKELNRSIMSAHRAGEIKWLVNKDILTTGYDWPPLDICGMLRHTQSPGLWVQMLGRLTRPYDFQNEQQYKPGFEYAKTNALILDFARNSERLGPVNDPKLPKKKGKGTGDAPIRLCESCGCYNHASARVCDECGEPFTFKPKITEQASQADVMRSPVPVVEFYNVKRVNYKKLQRPGATAMMHVEYHLKEHAIPVTEVVCLEHTGYAHKMACDWWRQRHATEPPTSTDEALQHQASLKVPTRIRVHVNLPRPRILNAEF